nr:MAG TPA: hypothetical protein [Caudoviricetes sp.]
MSPSLSEATCAITASSNARSVSALIIFSFQVRPGPRGEGRAGGWSVVQGVQDHPTVGVDSLRHRRVRVALRRAVLAGVNLFGPLLAGHVDLQVRPASRVLRRRVVAARVTNHERRLHVVVDGVEEEGDVSAVRGVGGEDSAGGVVVLGGVPVVAGHGGSFPGVPAPFRGGRWGVASSCCGGRRRRPGCRRRRRSSQPRSPRAPVRWSLRRRHRPGPGRRRRPARRSRRGGGRSQSWCSFPRGCILTRRAGIEDASVIFNPRRLSLPVLAVTVRRPGEPQCDQRDQQSQHRRYRADDGENLVHGSSSLCSWGIGFVPDGLSVCLHTEWRQAQGVHTNSGVGHSKEGGYRKHPTPS